MKLFYISKNYSDRFTASSKAKYDCECIMNSLGFYNIGLPISFIKSSYLGRLRTFLSNKCAFLKMPQNSIACLQYPVFDYKNQVQRCIRNKNRIITIIHDLNFLRGINENSDLEVLNKSDVLIVHTNRMKEWCLSNLSVKHIVVLNIFDYLYDNNNKPSFLRDNVKKDSIAFAGNLGKSAFLDLIHFDTVKLNLYGIGAEKRSLGESCIYRGCYPPDELYKHLDSMFGLVWDGKSTDTCTGITGEYLKYIAPHKISMYLSCGIPVIVWSKSAMADFVKKEQVGLVIDSINELEDIIKNISTDDYEAMCKKVSIIQKNIITGYYLSKALKEAFSCLGNKWIM